MELYYLGIEVVVKYEQSLRSFNFRTNDSFYTEIHEVKV